MKRSLAVILVVLFLLQAAVVHLRPSAHSDAEAAHGDECFEVRNFNWVRTNRDRIVDSHVEQDGFGGSWFDDFDDDSGIGGGLGGRLEADEHTVGLWHFDEGTGNEARDASENGNDGTLMNMEEEDWVDGKYGKALKFDGEDDYVASSFAFNPGSNSHTIEFWMKAPLLTESKAVVTGRTDHTFVIWAVEDTGKIMVHYGNDGSSWNIANAVGNRIGDSVIADNNWHHIVMVRDGNNVNNQPLKELAFYL